MMASQWRLKRADCRALGLRDAYSLHRAVYTLFEDVRSAQDKASSVPSGFLYADKGGDARCRTILMLSNRAPLCSEHGELVSKIVPDHFLQHARYTFEVCINPTKRDKATGKLTPIRGYEALDAWFAAKAEKSWGFTAHKLMITANSVQEFVAQGRTVTHGSATIRGLLQVTDRPAFIRSFTQGIGRGKAFGFGLLQLVPLSSAE